MVKDREASCAAVCGVSKSRTRLSEQQGTHEEAVLSVEGNATFKSTAANGE